MRYFRRATHLNIPDGIYSFDFDDDVWLADDDDDDDEAALLAANAFNAACILCGELNELKLPNCDNELSALSVAAAVALLFELLVLRLHTNGVVEQRNVQY